MTEGASYEFRIAATNLAGVGQPSDSSEVFKCEAWTAPEPGKSPVSWTRTAHASGAWDEPAVPESAAAGLGHVTRTMASAPRCQAWAWLCVGVARAAVVWVGPDRLAGDKGAETRALKCAAETPAPG